MLSLRLQRRLYASHAYSPQGEERWIRFSLEQEDDRERHEAIAREEHRYQFIQDSKALAIEGPKKDVEAAEEPPSFEEPIKSEGATTTGVRICVTQPLSFKIAHVSGTL